MTDASTYLGSDASDDDRTDDLKIAPSSAYATGSAASRGRHVLAGHRLRTALVDVMAILAGSAAALIARIGEDDVARSLGAPLPLLALLFVCTWVLSLAACGTYVERVLSAGLDEYRRVLVAGLWVFVLAVAAAFLLDLEVSRVYVVSSIVLSLALCLAGRWIGRLWLVRSRAAGRLLVSCIAIGDANHIAAVSKAMRSNRHAGYEVAAGIDVSGTTMGVAELTAELDHLVHATSAGALVLTNAPAVDAGVVARVGRYLEDQDLELLTAPDLAAIASLRRTFTPASGLPLMYCDEAALTPTQRFAKRSLDIVGATLGLLFLGLPMVVIAIAVRMTSSGPALFRQPRVGWNGGTFEIFKYRTMPVGSDDQRHDLRRAAGHDQPAFKIVDDPRVTPLGRFLRRWSIDELPQLINVARGEMTLVGPRPHPLDDVTRYRPEDHRRLLVRPGMTGLWQVEGRSLIPWDDAVKLDMHYIDTWSLAGDLVLLLRTVKAVITGHGAS